MSIIPNASMRTDRSAGRTTLFVISTVILLWFTHAIAFFAHEYSHSFMAWIFGWKANPLIINFGHADLRNFLMMIEMDEMVDYAPIRAAGHHVQIAIIAASGVAIGNGLLFLVSQAVFFSAARAGRRWLSMLLYWLCVMCVGNFLAYVPLRTFADVYDMGIVQDSLGISPWVIILVLGVPFAIGAWYLFARIVPNFVANVLDDATQRVIVVVLTPFVVFVFYGSAGWEPAFDVLSKTMAVVSMAVLFPLTTYLLWAKLVRRRVPG